MVNTPMVHAPGVIAAYDGSAEEMVRCRDEQCPMGRMGDAWDVAYAALFLASDEAKDIGECEPGSVAPFEQCATVSPTPVQAIGKWSAPGYAVCGCDRSIKTP
jgi:hypothetical protein